MNEGLAANIQYLLCPIQYPMYRVNKNSVDWSQVD